jgi:hypothetical protein
MSIDAIGQGNGADLLGLLTQSTSQGPTLQAASMSVLKMALNAADSTRQPWPPRLAAPGIPVVNSMYMPDRFLLF